MEEFTDKKLNSRAVINDVFRENERQLCKWGVQTHSLPEWHLYTSEELGELAEAIAEYMYRGGSKEEIYKEAIQTATLCLKIAEMVSTKEVKPNSSHD